jgi:hypothetical protein
MNNFSKRNIIFAEGDSVLVDLLRNRNTSSLGSDIEIMA